MKKLKSKKFVIVGKTKGGIAEIIGFVATTDMSFKLIGVKEFSGYIGEEILRADYETKKLRQYD